MSRYNVPVFVGLLALVAAPAFAQPTAPAQGTVMPRHMTHPAPAHKMPSKEGVNPDHSADMLNAKELASIQHGTPAEAPPPPPAPTAAPAKP